jgi:hypothetical protein
MPLTGWVSVSSAVHPDYRMYSLCLKLSQLLQRTGYATGVGGTSRVSRVGKSKQ